MKQHERTHKDFQGFHQWKHLPQLYRDSPYEPIIPPYLLPSKIHNVLEEFQSYSDAEHHRLKTKYLPKIRENFTESYSSSEAPTSAPSSSQRNRIPDLIQGKPTNTKSTLILAKGKTNIQKYGTESSGISKISPISTISTMSTMSTLP